MDRRVRFKSPNVTRDSYGQITPGFNNLDPADSSVGDVWADVIYKGSARETVQANSIYPERDLSFIIRDPRGSWVVSESLVVEYDGDTFDIVGINEIGRHEGFRVFGSRRRE